MLAARRSLRLVISVIFFASVVGFAVAKLWKGKDNIRARVHELSGISITDNVQILKSKIIDQFGVVEVYCVLAMSRREFEGFLHQRCFEGRIPHSFEDVRPAIEHRMNVDFNTWTRIQAFGVRNGGATGYVLWDDGDHEIVRVAFVWVNR